MENRLKPFEILPLDAELIADLRSDHAGECGAVAIYTGILAVYRTIAAVETFVEQHYREQIEKIKGEPKLADLAAKLRRFCEEEVEHRDDAADRLEGHVGYASRLWIRVVGTGSSLGVALARKL